MTNVYLDSSAIVDWLMAPVSGAPAKSVKSGARVDLILSDPSTVCGTGELAVIEVLNTLHNIWRRTEVEFANFDGAWVRDSQAKLLGMAGDAQVKVMHANNEDFEHALMLVSRMTELGRSFRAWDAVHLRLAVEWSRAEGGVVELATSDGDFAAFFDVHPVFSRQVCVRELHL